jgi:hypothetical protein
LTSQNLAASYGRDDEPSLRPDVVIGCVDTRAARAIIAKSIGGSSGVGYRLDVGNSRSSGQFVSAFELGKSALSSSQCQPVAWPANGEAAGRDLQWNRGA